MGRDILRKLGIIHTARKNADKNILMHDVLTKREMWRYDGLSEDKLNIAYREPEALLHILEKVENELKELIKINKLSKYTNALTNFL